MKRFLDGIVPKLMIVFIPIFCLSVLIVVGEHSKEDFLIRRCKDIQFQRKNIAFTDNILVQIREHNKMVDKYNRAVDELWFLEPPYKELREFGDDPKLNLQCEVD